MCVTAACVCFLAFFVRKEKKQCFGPDLLLDMKTFSFLGLKSRGGNEIKAAGKKKRICDCVCACACFGVGSAGQQFCDSSRTPGVSPAL